MSINWTTRDLTAYLKKVDIKAKDVRRGDILVIDGMPRQITKRQITDTASGDELYNFYDIDGNGGGPYKKNDKVRIISRSAIAKDPYE